MARQIINLSDEVWLALKDMAAKRKKTVGQIIEESLILRGIKAREKAIDLVRQARTRSAVTVDKAIAISVRETRKTRHSQSRSRIRPTE